MNQLKFESQVTSITPICASGDGSMTVAMEGIPDSAIAHTAFGLKPLRYQ